MRFHCCFALFVLGASNPAENRSYLTPDRSPSKATSSSAETDATLWSMDNGGVPAGAHATIMLLGLPPPPPSLWWSRCQPFYFNDSSSHTAAANSTCCCVSPASLISEAVNASLSVSARNAELDYSAELGESVATVA